VARCGVGGGINSGKKVVSSEAVDLGSPRREAKLSARQPEYDDQGEEDDQEDDFANGDRPIRPKATVDYNDRDPEIEPISKLKLSSLSVLLSQRTSIPSTICRRTEISFDRVPSWATSSGGCAQYWRAPNSRRAQGIVKVREMLDCR
jgi:CRISPR/Cas system-associated protein Cas5 (RAMP superfamily)